MPTAILATSDGPLLRLPYLYPCSSLALPGPASAAPPSDADGHGTGSGTRPRRLHSQGSSRYAPPVPNPDFPAAARRHHQDARLLLDDRRWPNADHLAGVAAECGLKAILLGYFGATLGNNSRPVWGQPAKPLGHVNHLWNELPLIISGRSAPVFAALIAGPPPQPFASWDIADRYSDGNTITEQCAREHLDMAKKIMGLLEQAVLNGVVP